MAVVADPGDDDVSAEKRQRKRVLNRINQRARRERLHSDAEGQNQSQSQSRARRRPFKIERWRVEELEFLASSRAQSTFRSGYGSRLAHSQERADEHPQELERSAAVSDARAMKAMRELILPPSTPRDSHGFPAIPPLSADHTLLNLIHHNVIRGLRSTKLILWQFASHYVPGYNAAPRTIHPDVLFYGSSLISSFLDSLLPDSLMPTETQMRKIHATWINILPFPRMRENLIRREREFDHVEFIRDLVGLHVGFDTGKFFSLPSATGVGEKGASSQVQVVVEHEENDGVTDGRHGLILWDEPHRVESWEATPGFLRKWMWTLEGCEELIESSNRWRRVRGEEPIRVVMQETKK